VATTKNGLVVMTKAVEHLCRLITRYQVQMIAAVNAAVIGGFITSAEGATLIAWINALSGTCAILKKVTGY